MSGSEDGSCEECDPDQGRYYRRRINRPGLEALQWITASNGHIPRYAVYAGENPNGRVYVGRANHTGHLLPGRVVPSEGSLYVAMASLEHSKTTYEVLTNRAGCDLNWISAPKGPPPNGAVPGGKQVAETLYIGRKMMDGYMTVGKVHPIAHHLYLSWKGKQHCFDAYEILVCTPEL